MKYRNPHVDTALPEHPHYPHFDLEPHDQLYSRIDHPIADYMTVYTQHLRMLQWAEVLETKATSAATEEEARKYNLRSEAHIALAAHANVTLAEADKVVGEMLIRQLVDDAPE